MDLVGRLLSRWWMVALAILVAGAGLFWFLRVSDGDAAPYRTAAVERGSLVRAVSATGQLQPVVAVEVGSTVSGPLKTVEVDFNARVKQGQVLARIDPESFQQRVRQLSATLAQARASASQARAEAQRYNRLAQEGFASDQLQLQASTELERAEAAVALAQAQLAAAQIELDRTVIRSPVDGVVVERAVDPGQTVAASFSAPKLFVIAQDLSQLEASIAVDEADIGGVQEGMPVRFTVDAYPDATFDGSVSQVRIQGAQESGVVSYTVIVRADNPRGRLLPGMTANAEIVLEEREDALRVPNQALRFTPSDERLQEAAKALAGGAEGNAKSSGAGGGNRGSAMFDRLAGQLQLTEAQREAGRSAVDAARAGLGPFPGPEATQGQRQAYFRRMREATRKALEPILTPEQRKKLSELGGGGSSARPAVLWVLRDDKPQPAQVRLGIASDAHTELVSGLDVGDLVIIGGGPRPKEKSGGFPGAGGGPRIRGV